METLTAIQRHRVGTAKILVILGTRPEAIKLCPVILNMKNRPSEFQTRVCVTAQHRDMLDQVLGIFNVEPDYDLDLMTPGQTLHQCTARVIASLEPVLKQEQPDIVLVQGDTTSTLCGALSAFYANIPVGHVEAGLRTWDARNPFPEEMNRVLTSRLAALHFAATDWAADNLLREGIDSKSIIVTGNSGIDAVLHVSDRLATCKLQGVDLPQLDPKRKLIVVTAHRRESFGAGFERICGALARLARRKDVQIVYPVHPNPNVQDAVNRLLACCQNVVLIKPVSYVSFVDLMRRAYILMTDSGGIQEEGPSLGKPILVMRDTTERPEGVAAGTVRLVGTDERRIVEEAESLLDSAEAYNAMTRVHNPYGDGHASERIAHAIRSFVGFNSTALVAV